MNYYACKRVCLMFRVMIVDDEKYDALLLKNAVGWEELGLTLCAQAQNGQRALELAAQHRPDIVITDIVMPRKNGIDFTVELKKLCPQVHIVFVSGHQDFDYARQGIQAGVDGYLLKPVKPAEINAVLGRIVAKCVEEKRRLWEHTMFRSQLEVQLPYMREVFLNRWMFAPVQDGGEPEEDLKFYGVKLEGRPLCAAVILPDAQPQGDGEYSRQLRRFELRRAIEEAIGEELCCNLFDIFGGEGFGLLTSSGSSTEERFREIISSVSQLCGAVVTVGVGSSADTPAGLPESFRNARAAADNRFFFGSGQVIFYDGISVGGTSAPPDTAVAAAELAQAVINADSVSAGRTLSRLYREMYGARLSPALSRNACAGVISVVTAEMGRLSSGAAERYFSSRAPYQGLFGAKTLEEIIGVMREELEAMSELLAVNAGRHLDFLVDSIKRYIDENLDKPLTVENIAAQVNLSRGYATQLFKRRTGEPINRYLVNRRMEKAKELLAGQTLSVADIGRMVGYDNPSYFASVFRNEVGVVPREYRDRFA